jgi:archaellum component FlaF (FlaF/FlaG flagellin family)
MLPRNAKKALTPLMASMILLCIAVAITLATLAWINGLPTTNMYTEKLDLTSQQWGPNCTYIDVTLYNNGTQSVKLKSVTVNSQPATVIYIAGSNQIGKGETATLRIATTFTPEETYQLTFQTTKGNKFTYTATT